MAPVSPGVSLSIEHEHALLQIRLMQDIRQELRDLRDVLEQNRSETSRSSVQLEQDSKGVIKPTVKVYDGSPSDDLAERAWEVFSRAKVLSLSVAENAGLDAWRTTLDMLKGSR